MTLNVKIVATTAIAIVLVLIYMAGNTASILGAARPDLPLGFMKGTTLILAGLAVMLTPARRFPPALYVTLILILIGALVLLFA